MRTTVNPAAGGTDPRTLSGRFALYFSPGVIAPAGMSRLNYSLSFSQAEVTRRKDEDAGSSFAGYRLGRSIRKLGEESPILDTKPASWPRHLLEACNSVRWGQLTHLWLCS